MSAFFEIWPQIFGLLATVLGFTVATVSFLTFRRATVRYRDREARLPEATRLVDVGRQAAEVEKQLFFLKGEVGEAHSAIGHAEAARREIQELERKSGELRVQLGALEQEFADRRTSGEIELVQRRQQLRLELDGLEEEAARRRASVESELVQYRQQLRLELEGLEEEAARRRGSAEADLRKHIETLQRELADLEREQKVAQQRTEHDHEARMRQLNANYEARKHEFLLELNPLKASLDKATKEEKRLSDELATLKTDAREAQKAQDSLRRETSAMAAEKAQLERTLPQLQELWRRLMEQTGGGDDASRTTELWQPVFAAGQTLPQTPESEALTRVENYLASRGLRYGRRTLNAFHASLKVADSSPLTVLAGISGTGKSELPRRYAEAMGMNFLNLAVQPRWDSPQDMFGFFNYLEHRFRATELGRSLVQMDPFATSKGRGWPDPLPNGYVNLSKQMLLVLLDEMNLARVEYYFSEFLSRLETRRGVRTQDAADRRKAEVPLEVGRSGAGDPIMRIFVATNVLFVGTMNEDETTQTLSDKVVDRANVLRFGRPRRLRSGEAMKPTDPPAQRLSHDAWRRWVVDQPNEADGGRVEDWIERLNAAMSEIGRPFAYRTNRAMLAYVANYPEEGERATSLAMADQVEQKLLPKFRGLDPSEPEVRKALDKIQVVVRELEDPPLEEAMRESRQAHQFVWKGVDRSAEEAFA